MGLGDSPIVAVSQSQPDLSLVAGQIEHLGTFRGQFQGDGIHYHRFAVALLLPNLPGGENQNIIKDGLGKMLSSPISATDP